MGLPLKTLSVLLSFLMSSLNALKMSVGDLVSGLLEWLLMVVRAHSQSAFIVTVHGK